MARPTGEERRVDYLRIGAEIVSEFDATRAASGPVDALANVRVADVARRAGVTKGALYHIWESQEAYRRDLLAHLLEMERQTGFEDTRTVIEELPPGLDPSSTMVRLSQYAFDRLKDDPACYTRFSFIAYAQHPDVREVLAPGSSDFGRYYQSFLDETGRRLRPSVTMDHLFLLTEAYLFGCLLRYRTSPELVESTVDTADGPTALYPFGLRALMEELTEPVGPEPEPA
jgi:AcrR family transcriptional regulator